MTFATLTHSRMQEKLGREIPEMVVLVAKNLILGSDSGIVADLFGVTRGEVDALIETADYKDCHLIMAAEYNSQSVETDISYDDIEARALQNISKRLDSEKDVDRLVRIATMANKAQRRHKPSNQLDSAGGGEVVRLQLSQRIVERLTNNGPEREFSRQISITGKDLNPTFEQVSHLLDAGAPKIEENYRIQGHAEFTDKDLLDMIKT